MKHDKTNIVLIRISNTIFLAIRFFFQGRHQTCRLKISRRQKNIFQETPTFTVVTLSKRRPHECKIRAARRKHVQYINVHVIMSLQLLSCSPHSAEKHGIPWTLGRDHV